MSILHRTHQPGRPAATVQASRMNRAWPAVITLTAVIVFIAFLVQTTLLMALVLALATLVAGGILLTLVSGTAWISRLRQLTADLRRHH
jgi:hypothetical protein